MTADELLHYLPPDPYRSELVRGRLVLRQPSKAWHGMIAGNLALLIHEWLLRDGAERGTRTMRGRVFIADAGFALATQPDTVRAPDLAYVNMEKTVAANLDRFDGMVPDLAFEVRSPANRWRTMLTRVNEFRAAGTPLVWIAERRQRRIHVFRLDGSVQVLEYGEMLDGEQVLPGFSAPVAEVFAGAAA